MKTNHVLILLGAVGIGGLAWYLVQKSKEEKAVLKKAEDLRKQAELDKLMKDSFEKGGELDDLDDPDILNEMSGDDMVFLSRALYG